MHKGNIWFRRLVRSNRALYKTCPKHTKLLVAKAVVKAVQGQDPPGRYLEADKPSGGWKEIPYKRALDKTSQALREREPNPTQENEGFSATAREAAASASKNASLDGLTKATLEQAGLLDDLRQSSGLQTEPITKPAPSKKRKEPEQFQKPAWWNQGTSIPTATQSNLNNMAASRGVEPILKRQKPQREEEEAPLPLDALQTRQSSFFNFLSNTGIFGSKPAPPPPPAQSSLMYGYNNGMQMNNNSQQMFGHMDMGRNNNSNNFAFSQRQQQYYGSGGNDQAAMLQQPKMHARNSLVDVFEPIPIGKQEGGNFANNSNNNNKMTLDQMQVRQQMQMIQQNSIGSRRDSAASNNGLGFEEPRKMPANYPQTNNEAVAARPPGAGLKTQLSDWLTSFFPPVGEDDGGAPPPPPPGQGDLQRSVSSTLFNMARSPSQFLTSLKSGVTSLFMNDNDASMSMPAPPPGALTQNQSFGTRSVKDSLLDDTEDSLLETQLRAFPSR